MANCNCNCDPCKCRKKQPCVPCITTSNTTTLPTCEQVADCVRDDFQKTLADFGTPLIDNICEVARKCVNEGFGNIADGSSSGMDNFPAAILAALKTFPGYTSTGYQTFVSINGQMQWVGASGTTTTSTTTTINPSAPTTTTLVLDTVYFGAKLSGTSPTVLEVLSGSTLNTDAANNVQINWNVFNASPQYLWFAIPTRTSEHVKNYYYFTTINQGNIGGALNLFSSPVSITINALPYYVWITNYATQTTEAALLSKI